MLQKKLDNATETIRHLNNKIDKMKEKWWLENIKQQKQ
jgi:hypothetical protein